MSDIFHHVHAFVARWEGGYVNHKTDPGGATNYGVSLRFLRSIGYDVDGDGDIDIDDIKALTPELAAELFRVHFWDASHCGSMPPLVAATVYDGAVNMGVSRAVKQLQTACNKTPGTWLAIDGSAGRQTIARVCNLSPCPEMQLNLCALVIKERELFYCGLADKPPYINKSGQTVDYRPFLKGWLNRTRTLRDLLRQMASEGIQ